MNKQTPKEILAVYKLIVKHQDNNLRLDKFLSQNQEIKALDISRSKIKNLILDGFVTIGKDNNILDDPSSLVKENEIISLSITKPELSDTKAKKIDINIVYEDNDLLVINKQAGLLSHPGAGNYDNSLVNALLYYCPNSLSSIGGDARPGIVHRLDKDTTGLMVVAKNDKSHKILAAQIEKRELKRVYKAVIWGTIIPNNGIIENNIGRNSKNRKIMAVVKNGGKKATTEYKTTEIFGNNIASLVECKLKTGRTHQIRVHMSNLGHSLIGDQTYGKNNRKILKYIKNEELMLYLNSFKRQALHSYHIGFIHPTKNEYMEFQTELPDDIMELVNKLRNNNFDN